MSPRPIVILTDFGTTDCYAGLLECVIAAHAPAVRCITLTHGIPPGNVLVGAVQLLGAVPYLPACVVLAVVDPGVGSSRKAVILQTGALQFVGPDNGLLWPAASSQGAPIAWEIHPSSGLPSARGQTFHGRDLFAPVAAQLALGRPPGDLGCPLADPVRLSLPRPVTTPEGRRGEVLTVDRFGNAITNLTLQDLPWSPGAEGSFLVAERVIPGPFTHYAQAPEGTPAVIIGSMGYLEIAIQDGSVAAALGIRPGQIVVALGAADAAPV